MAWQTDWKTLYQTDSDWLRVRKDGKDGGDPTLEHAEEIGEYEDENGDTHPKFQVFRVGIEKFKLTQEPEDPLKAYLVPSGYDSTWPHHPKAYEEWFAKDIESVARYCGLDPLALAKMFTSNDPKVRTGAYDAVAGYHGWNNFDSDPLELTEEQLDARWK